MEMTRKTFLRIASIVLITQVTFGEADSSELRKIAFLDPYTWSLSANLEFPSTSYRQS